MKLPTKSEYTFIIMPKGHGKYCHSTREENRRYYVRSIYDNAIYVSGSIDYCVEWCKRNCVVVQNRMYIDGERVFIDFEH